MKIGKYEFDSLEQANSKINALGEEHNHTIVKLGNIVLEQENMMRRVILQKRQFTRLNTLLMLCGWDLKSILTDGVQKLLK